MSSKDVQAIEQANASGRAPIVFVHGLWLLAGSWTPWAAHAEAAGYAPVPLTWPDEPETVREARAKPEVFARKSVGAVADHLAELIGRLERRPALVGHNFGGVLVQILAGRGLSAATVAIGPEPFRGVLTLPLSSLRASMPVLGSPFNRRRAVPLTFPQFRYAFANAVSEEEARELYDTFAVPASGVPLFQQAGANLNPRTDLRVDTRNPDRGPLLILAGEKDTSIPWALAHAAHRRQKRNAGVTEITEMPGRGHSLVIDSGWKDVADAALAFVRRHVPAGPAGPAETGP
ncbi:alpha/beta fold hydrolase [Streptomyces albiaxialis]|uniref:Alpha/beta fold hydrolase n=1 Tax=Streptomyces albiaxialis TaxID=329523 RepID=A0ABN2VIR3_9ACTN